MTEPSPSSTKRRSSLPKERVEQAWGTAERVVYEYFGRGRIRLAIRTIVQNLSRHHALDLAGSMAFDLFLALIPLLALAGWVLSLVLSGDAQMMQNISVLLDLTPSDVRHVVNQHAERFFGSSLAPFALGGALWLASGAFATVMAAFQRTVTTRERSWWFRRLMAIFCVLVVLVAISVGGWFAVQLSGVPHMIAGLVPGQFAVGIEEYIGLFVSGVALTGMVALFFRIGVSRDVPRRRVWPGTAVTILIGGTASYLLSLYVSTLARYAFYYGSLAAVAVLLIWLWICSFALLLGAELNAYLEEQELSPPRSSDRVPQLPPPFEVRTPRTPALVPAKSEVEPGPSEVVNRPSTET